MSAADKLAQVLAEHAFTHYDRATGQYTCTSCGAPFGSRGGMIDFAAHQAAVVLAHLTAEGWAQGREEWGVMVDEPTFVDHGRLIKNYGADREAAEEFSAPWRGVKVSRRRVTDWEPVETGDQE